jgi:hypothetical protein
LKNCEKWKNMEEVRMMNVKTRLLGDVQSIVPSPFGVGVSPSPTILWYGQLLLLKRVLLRMVDGTWHIAYLWWVWLCLQFVLSDRVVVYCVIELPVTSPSSPYSQTPFFIDTIKWNGQWLWRRW